MNVILLTQYFAPFLPCQMDLGNAVEGATTPDVSFAKNWVGHLEYW